MVHRTRSNTFVLALLLVCLFPLAGCIEERIVRQAFSDLPVDPGGPAPFTGMGWEQQRQQQQTEIWTIPLDRFEGPGRHQRAQQRIGEIRRHAEMGQLWIEDFEGESVIYHGRFRDEHSDGAREALRYTRDLYIDGERPFDDASLVPLSGSERVSDPYDLRQYSGDYSLQIAVYDDSYAGDRFEAAEDQVADLRADEHEAYYYHGPHRSMVTVGRFHQEQAFDAVDNPLAQRSQVDAYSQLVRELQQQFPHHRVNDVSVVEATDGQIPDEPPSVLIRVP